MYKEIDNLLAILKNTGKNYDIDKIKKAFSYARELHDGQFRVSGEPYISHPIAVAEILAGLELDTDSICAALLHDTVEDCSDKTDLSYIEKEYGPEVALLVDGVTKIINFQVENKEEAEIENLRKMFIAMSKDIRVIFIKLCDRLHNMRTLDAKPEAKRRETALETMHVFAPLAHRLGMQKIKQELERLSLSYLDPIGFEEVQSDIERKYGQNRDFIERCTDSVSAKLREYNLTFKLEGRVKTVYSIYKKMYNQNKSFDEIYDFYALRIIVDTELECYTVLGIIHEIYKSVPGRFKDYISTPKPNLYRSLHTTVIGHDGIPFEVQIRTHEMHQIAEYGIAAHWKYKAGDMSSREDVDRKLEWVAKLIETNDDTMDPDEFLSTLKIDIFHDETFVFTPKGDVIVLPQGATLIDFAYAIHSAVGNKMIGAKINGAIAPIDSVPENGQIVEVLTSSASKGPSRDWLKIVKTSEARNKIRQWFKKEKRSENIVVGRAEFDKEFKKFGRPYTDSQRSEILTNVAQRIGIKSEEDLCNTVGYGGLSVSKISGRIKDEFDRVVAPEVQTAQIVTEPSQIVKAMPSKRHKTGGGIIVDGQAGCLVKFAKCCNPLPGDKVVGFVTKGYGISIHKHDCPNVKGALVEGENATRFVSAHWDTESIENTHTYDAFVQIYAVQSITLLADITAALAEMKVTLLSINYQTKNGGEVVINLNLACRNLEHVKSIVSRLRAVNGVDDVKRGFA